MMYALIFGKLSIIEWFPLILLKSEVEQILKNSFLATNAMYYENSNFFLLMMPYFQYIDF